MSGKLGLLGDHVAIITGGGGEIGSAIAERFSDEGARVVVSDCSLAKAQEASERIRANGGQSIAVKTDISDPDDTEYAVETAIDSFQKLTTVVNVAATVAPLGTVETLTLDEWNNVLAVNLTGAFLMAKYAVPALRAANGGTITNIASQLGQIGVPKRAPYSTSKAALIHLSKCLAVDHAKDNIRVNFLSPGAVDTSRVLRHNITREEANKRRGPLHLLGRTGTVGEIAAAAAFLASEESSFMTGAELLIDGGYLAFKQQ